MRTPALVVVIAASAAAAAAQDHVAALQQRPHAHEPLLRQAGAQVGHAHLVVAPEIHRPQQRDVHGHGSRRASAARRRVASSSRSRNAASTGSLSVKRRP